MCAVSVDDVRAVAEHDPQPAAGRRPRPAHAGRVLRRRAHDRPAHPLARGGARPHRAPARADRRRARRRAQGRAGPGGGDRVVRPGLRGRPLDAAADRPGRRDRRARLPRRALRAEHLGDRGRGGAAGGGRHALRLRRRALARGGRRPRRRPARRSAPSASSPSTPRPTSRGPGRAWWTASSSWPTSCIPTWCPSPRGRSSRSRSETAHGPLPALLERPLRSRSPAARDRRGAGPGAFLPA